MTNQHLNQEKACDSKRMSFAHPINATHIIAVVSQRYRKDDHIDKYLRKQHKGIIMKKRYKDESERHERRESRSQEQREERMESRGYRETESGQMVKSQPRRSLVRGK